VRVELVTDCRPDQVGAIGVETFVDQQIDTAKVDISNVNRDFLGLARFVSQPMHISGQSRSPYTIPVDGVWMVTGPIASEKLAQANTDAA
jgi:hypothetical protein